MTTKFQPTHDTIQDLHPYSAGRPIEEVAKEKGLSRIIKLASNENPMGMSPKAVEAVKKAADDLHRYRFVHAPDQADRRHLAGVASNSHRARPPGRALLFVTTIFHGASMRSGVYRR